VSEQFLNGTSAHYIGYSVPSQDGSTKTVTTGGLLLLLFTLYRKKYLVHVKLYKLKQKNSKN